MKNRGSIITERLELVPMTLELCEAELNNAAIVGQLLGARLPDSWPPPVFERDDMERIRRRLKTDSTAENWTLYYVLRRPAGIGDGQKLVGVAGFISPPTENGSVEIGYAISTEHQRHGYATEAVKALISQAFADSCVSVISATTYQKLEPSIKVLEKTGFARISHESESGLIRYARRRDPAIH